MTSITHRMIPDEWMRTICYDWEESHAGVAPAGLAVGEDTTVGPELADISETTTLEMDRIPRPATDRLISCAKPARLTRVTITEVVSS